MVGAIDLDTTDNGNTNEADVTDIDALSDGADIEDILNGNAPANTTLAIKQFIRSGFSTASTTLDGEEGLYSDRVKFSKKDSTIYSNVSQIVKSTNEYVKPSDKLVDQHGEEDPQVAYCEPPDNKRLYQKPFR
jgi:hypothetical protein